MRLALVSSLALAAVAACDPYNPNLSNTPFRCAEVEPLCPSGYECASGFCIEEGSPLPVDADSDGQPSVCEDEAEPNDELAVATPGALFDQLDVIMLEGLSMCPTMDTDLFKLNQTLNCGGKAQPACPNLDVDVVWEDTENTPSLAVLNQAGTVITNGVPDGAGTLHASGNNLPQGTYYVRVTSQAVISHYRLTIDGRRTE